MPLSEPDFDPKLFAGHYRRFRVAERCLLTGHSHQAWPDCAYVGQMRAFEDAAELADRKWDRAFAVAGRVQQGFAQLLGDTRGSYTLGANTHELVVRFLSALPLVERPKLVTTEGEFHSIRRQLDRLEETGLEIVRLPVSAPETLVERAIEALDDRTAAVLISAVLFESGRIVPHLSELAAAGQQRGIEVLIDAYHALNVVPFQLDDSALDTAFVVGGGYKYCQLGEGNCFLRVPPDRDLRPIVTGWFAEFADLSRSPSGDSKVGYGSGAEAFAGSTYDPVSHYRAAEVFDFFGEQRLTPFELRSISLRQVTELADAFDRLDLDPRIIDRDRRVAAVDRGGFLVLTSDRASDYCRQLAERGVSTDSRGSSLRFGPAPYVTDEQLRFAMQALGEVVEKSRSSSDSKHLV